MRYDDLLPIRLARFCAICGGPGGASVRWSDGMPEPVAGDSGIYVHPKCVEIVRHRRATQAALAASATETTP